MAPGLTDLLPSSPPLLHSTPPQSKATFPDGIKTSGQHPPQYNQLQPYSSFPKQITGPTVWKAEDYANNPERWTHQFTEEELAEMSDAADQFLAAGTPLTGITKVFGCKSCPGSTILTWRQESFPLPSFATSLQTLRAELLNGKGFILFKGLPVEQWGNHKLAVAYMGLGTYLGYFVSQNSRGHVLGHVKDVGEDSKQIDKVRIYRTNARCAACRRRCSSAEIPPE